MRLKHLIGPGYVLAGAVILGVGITVGQRVSTVSGLARDPEPLMLLEVIAVGIEIVGVANFAFGVILIVRAMRSRGRASPSSTHP